MERRKEVKWSRRIETERKAKRTVTKRGVIVKREERRGRQKRKENEKKGGS